MIKAFTEIGRGRLVSRGRLVNRGILVLRPIFYGGRPRSLLFLSKNLLKEVSVMGRKKIFGHYDGYFDLRDPDGGYGHLELLRDNLWDYLKDYLDERVLTAMYEHIIYVDVKIDFKRQAYDVYVYPDTEDYHKFDEYLEYYDYDNLEKFLNDLAYRVGSSLWYMEEYLLMEYEEELA